MNTRSNRPVAITGVGIITSLGKGKEANWSGLTAGRSGIHRLTRFPTEGLNTTIGGSVDFIALDDFTAPNLGYAMARETVREALSEAGLSTDEPFPGQLFLAAPPIEHEWPVRLRLAARGATPTHDAILAADLADLQSEHDDFLYATIADRLVAEFHTQGSPITLSTACASGASAIQLGAAAIRRGSTKAALCVGTDGSITPEALIRFSLLSALSTSNGDPEKAAKPFSRNRDGFVMAEGAAALVLEDAEIARARGATILGYVSGCGEAADTFHRTRSNPTGEAIIRAMRSAVEDAGLAPEDIGYVNAHGTGTPENDKMECLGITELFGARVGKLPVSSNKSMVGHTLTAAGAVEAVFSLLTLRNQLLPPTINYETPDPAIPLDVVPNAARRASLQHVISNSFGFGGQNVSLVLSLEPR